MADRVWVSVARLRTVCLLLLLVNGGGFLAKLTEGLGSAPRAVLFLGASVLWKTGNSVLFGVFLWRDSRWKLLVTTPDVRAQMRLVAHLAPSTHKTVQKVGGTVKAVNFKEGISQAKERLRSVAVLGRLVGATPDLDELVKYAEAVSGGKPFQVEIMADHSFMLTMNSAEEAEKLVASTELYMELIPVHIEAWSSQAQHPVRTIFKTRLVWVQLPGL